MAKISKIILEKKNKCRRLQDMLSKVTRRKSVVIRVGKQISDRTELEGALSVAFGRRDRKSNGPMRTFPSIVLKELYILIIHSEDHENFYLIPYTNIDSRRV